QSVSLRQRFLKFAAANRLRKQPNVWRGIPPAAGRRERHQRFSASKIALAFGDKSKQRKRARIEWIGQKGPPRQVLNRAKLAAAARQLPFRQFIQRNRLPGRYKQTSIWVSDCQIVSSRVRDNEHSDKSKCEERKDDDGRRQPLSRRCRPLISIIADGSAVRSANGI